MVPARDDHGLGRDDGELATGVERALLGRGGPPGADGAEAVVLGGALPTRRIDDLAGVFLVARQRRREDERRQRDDGSGAVVTEALAHGALAAYAGVAACAAHAPGSAGGGDARVRRRCRGHRRRRRHRGRRRRLGCRCRRGRGRRRQFRARRRRGLGRRGRRAHGSLRRSLGGRRGRRRIGGRSRPTTREQRHRDERRQEPAPEHHAATAATNALSVRSRANERARVGPIVPIGTPSSADAWL